MEDRLFVTIEKLFEKNNISDINNIHKNNIICHLRDEEFITKVLLILNKDIPYSKIYDFVKNNKNFHILRDNYEQYVIKNYLLYFKKFIWEEEYETLHLEEIFRQAVINNLTSIGLNRISVEKCLETNIDLWFNDCVMKSFNEQFHYEEDSSDSYYHKMYYMKLKKYDYYQNHSYIINLYGTVTPEMMMSSDELIKLQESLLEMNNKKLILK